MYQNTGQNAEMLGELAQMGTGAVAYMRQISAAEIVEKFPQVPEIEAERSYWAMFAADGTPLMLADSQSDLASSAYFNDLVAILPS